MAATALRTTGSDSVPIRPVTGPLTVCHAGNPHVLGVDDDHNHHRLVARWLEREGFDVTTTDHAQP